MSWPREERLAAAAALLLCAALLCAPWAGHIDDVDAQLYLVIARHLARDPAWFDLRFLPGVWPRFREHLPFGFWPAAAAVRLFGEGAVPPLYAAFTLGAIAAAGRIAARLAGPRAFIGAVLLLGTCESIWQYGGRLLLDPPLLCLTALALDAALAERWPLASLFTALAVLVKGPFGLLPLAAFVLVSRLPWRGVLAAGCACLPLAIFLWADPGGGWRDGYLRAQLFASASGARTDGVTSFWFPLAVIAGRFWPGLPFALWGARRARPLALTCALSAALLCLPARKWGNHAYVLFPLLGALAGVGAAELLQRLRPRALALGTAALAAVACALSLAGLGRLVLRPPCPFSAFTGLTPGSRVFVVQPVQELLPLVELAAEREVEPVPAAALPPPGSVRLALVASGTPLPAAWQLEATSGPWLLLRAASAPPAR